MLHVRLDSRGVERLVVSKELEIERVVFEVGLKEQKKSSKLAPTHSKQKIKNTLFTFSLSEFIISVFNSFTLASRIADLVTLRNASSMRYLNASTCFISKWYSFILLPLAPCSFSIFANTP